MHLKTSSAKWCPFSPGRNLLLCHYSYPWLLQTLVIFSNGRITRVENYVIYKEHRLYSTDSQKILISKWESHGNRVLAQFKDMVFTSIGNPIVEIRRSYGRLISTMGFPIHALVRPYLYIESGPSSLCTIGRLELFTMPTVWTYHQQHPTAIYQITNIVSSYDNLNITSAKALTKKIT